MDEWTKRGHIVTKGLYIYYLISFHFVPNDDIMFLVIACHFMNQCVQRLTLSFGK